MNLIQKPSSVAAVRNSLLYAAAIREGLDSGPAEPFNMEAILAEARSDLPVAIADLERKLAPTV